VLKSVATANNNVNGEHNSSNDNSGTRAVVSLCAYA